MKVNLSIFKSRDIRGIYPQELDEKTAYKIGRAFILYTRAKEVVVGRDMRISSPTISESLIKGIIEQGADVLNLGQVPVECLYFSVGYYKIESGIMITASHNPKEYNGFKMIKKEKEKEIIDMIRGRDLISIIEKNEFSNPGKAGRIKKFNVLEDFIEHIFSFIDVKKIKPFKVVVDAGNGMAGKVIPEISSRLPIKIIPLNFELDGNFPVHHSNPLLEGVTDQISREVRKRKADFGFIFDGDADRIYLIDELGNFIRGDITLLLLAKYLLKKKPGRGIAYNLICSRAVPEFIKKWGGKPVRTAVGVVEIRNGMLNNDGIMGGELSGHYIFKDNFYLDSGFIVFLILLQIISESDKKVSELTRELSPYAKGAEINFEVEDKEKIIKKVREQFSDGKQDYLDGITVEYQDWWFNVRSSQTEPLLRLTIEANTQKLLQQKQKELSSLILS